MITYFYILDYDNIFTEKNEKSLLQETTDEIATAKEAATAEAPAAEEASVAKEAAAEKAIAKEALAAEEAPAAKEAAIDEYTESDQNPTGDILGNGNQNQRRKNIISSL